MPLCINIIGHRQSQNTTTRFFVPDGRDTQTATARKNEPRTIRFNSRDDSVFVAGVFKPHVVAHLLGTRKIDYKFARANQRRMSKEERQHIKHGINKTLGITRAWKCNYYITNMYVARVPVSAFRFSDCLNARAPASAGCGFGWTKFVYTQHNRCLRRAAFAHAHKHRRTTNPSNDDGHSSAGVARSTSARRGVHSARSALPTNHRHGTMQNAQLIYFSMQ